MSEPSFWNKNRILQDSVLLRMLLQWIFTFSINISFWSKTLPGLLRAASINCSTSNKATQCLGLTNGWFSWLWQWAVCVIFSWYCKNNESKLEQSVYTDSSWLEAMGNMAADNPSSGSCHINFSCMKRSGGVSTDSAQSEHWN